ncbi:hypothetical protein [Asanoa siamensis]|uniref:hypothetical protein n=1 Tax=Asanoa siamensis TaxID=926357 RepID=UPI001941498F|nr:hypothetical protein [Asanoa siamensis]
MPEGVPSIDRVAGQWDGPRDRWPAAFTPGNDTFSGHLPALVGAPDALARTYYRAAWAVVSGEAAGPRAAALLDPAATRARLLAELAGDADEFRAVHAYLALTGDLDLLAEKAGGATVLDRIRALVAAPVPGGEVAADAVRAGRGRVFAALLRRLGEADEAAVVEIEAADRARAVLARYAGAGRWRSAETSDDVCLTVATEIPEFLDLRQRADLADVVGKRAGDAYALCRLGRHDRAAAVLAEVARPGAAELEAILGGLFGLVGSRPFTARGCGRLDNLPAALTSDVSQPDTLP